jgi:hypothetical protein
VPPSGGAPARGTIWPSECRRMNTKKRFCFLLSVKEERALRDMGRWAAVGGEGFFKSRCAAALLQRGCIVGVSTQKEGRASLSRSAKPLCHGLASVALLPFQGRLDADVPWKGGPAQPGFSCSRNERGKIALMPPSGGAPARGTIWPSECRRMNTKKRFCFLLPVKEERALRDMGRGPL